MSLIVRVESVSKKYVIGHQQPERHDTLRDEISRGARALVQSVIHPFFGGRANERGKRMEDFWALRDVSFDVQEGERLGIVGRNGAGKSTLLKILSRITEPTNGRVAIGGRLASLLEVGTGFHPELTGRENIFLNGAVLGMSKEEIARKFDEIVDFAEVEKFLDTPVKRYSSGMYVRLAFAVAAHLEPEILIVDEVLAVGDIKFQKKCLGKMERIGQQGRTILFVSHNMQAIRQLCDRAILLANGETVADGPSGQVVARYLRASTAGDESNPDSLNEVVRALPPDPDCRFLKITLLQDGRFSNRPVCGKELQIVFEFEILREAYGFHVFFRLGDGEGNVIFESVNCGEEDRMPNLAPGFYRSIATVPANLLAPRRYDISLGAGIAHVRHCMPEPIRMMVDVQPGGRVNGLFPGYEAPGVLLPSIPWRTDTISIGEVEQSARKWRAGDSG